jgi:hypothetical protein
VWGAEMKGARQEGFQYRVRYRREFGQEKVRIFGRLFYARRFIEKLKAYDGGDPMFSSEPLIYAVIDRRSVGEWDRTWEDDRR